MFKLEEMFSFWTILLLFFPSMIDAWEPSVEAMLEKEKDAESWYYRGAETIEKVISKSKNKNIAKNIIIFVGDGMGVSTVTAGRIFKGQKNGKPGEENILSFETFDDVALSKVYSLDYSTPDSASTATAFLSGVKTNMGVVGYDGNVQYHNCASTKQAKKLNSVLDWARAAGKKTGIITTSRVTHATPAAAYAHTPARWWEVINFIPRKDRAKCKDIAVQLIEDNDHINVIMGGGRSFFLPSGMEDPEIKSMIGFQRMDGRNLVEEWEEDKKRKGSKYAYVWNRNMFKDIDDDVEYILGLFNPSHMEYDLERTKYGRRGEPSMSEMVNKAISVLEKGDDGFVLIVEGARIDHGHHANMPMLSLNDVSAFDDAVKKAKQRTDADDTLIVVTADHSHGFDITGYQQRGSDIFGKQDEMEPTDDKPMTILHYANGPGHDEPRENLTNIDTTSSVVRFPAGVPLHSGTHSGEDVAIYANGPMSHLVNGVQEQSYIAFVMAYSACIGPYGTGRMNRWCKKGRT